MSPFNLASESEVDLDEVYRETNLGMVSFDRHSDDCEPSSPWAAAALDDVLAV